MTLFEYRICIVILTILFVSPFVMLFYSLENRQDDKDILIEIIEKEIANEVIVDEN